VAMGVVRVEHAARRRGSPIRKPRRVRLIDHT
jgi:hypothetical protein